MLWFSFDNTIPDNFNRKSYKEAVERYVPLFLVELSCVKNKIALDIIFILDEKLSFILNNETSRN